MKYWQIRIRKPIKCCTVYTCSLQCQCMMTGWQKIYFFVSIGALHSFHTVGWLNTIEEHSWRIFQNRVSSYTADCIIGWVDLFCIAQYSSMSYSNLLQIVQNSRVSWYSADFTIQYCELIYCRLYMYNIQYSRMSWYTANSKIHT